jgi:hypothetical protein
MHLALCIEGGKYMTGLNCVISNAASAFGPSICIASSTFLLVVKPLPLERQAWSRFKYIGAAFGQRSGRTPAPWSTPLASPRPVPANRRQEQLKLSLLSVPCFFGNFVYKLEVVVQLRGHRRRTIPRAVVPRREKWDEYEERGGLEV